MIFSEIVPDEKNQKVGKSDGFGFSGKIIILPKMREADHFLPKTALLNFFLNLFINTVDFSEIT